jgi:hypothetical protein
MKLFPVAFALVAPVQAGLRFGCSSLTIQRLDPVVEPGMNPSSHVHHIVGGNAFNATMTGDVGARGTCTTCQMSEDFSNYWTAVLYFKHPTNGSYHRVPVTNNAALAAGTTGGMTIYYTQYDFFHDNVKTQPVRAFPPVGLSYTPSLSWVQKTSNACVLGIPYDGWQPRHRQSFPGQGPHWPAIQLLEDATRQRPRDGRFPRQALRRWSFHRAPLSRVSKCLNL